MKKQLAVFSVATLLGSVAPALHGANVIDFDGVPSGSEANSATPAGVSFYNAHLSLDQDSSGADIAGSEKWQIDTANPSLDVSDPNYRGYGKAPSGINALNAVDQPVLMLLAQPINLGFFSVTLDNSTRGNPGDSPIQFYSRNGNVDTLVGSLSADQSISGYTAATADPLASVDLILFPSGAYYDNISMAAVPEPATTGVVLAVAAAVGAIWLRRKA